MSIMIECKKNLNLNLKEETYKTIYDVAKMKGRKPGNFARLILENWAKKNRQIERQ
jgi:hypothetical protein